MTERPQLKPLPDPVVPDIRERAAKQAAGMSVLLGGIEELIEEWERGATYAASAGYVASVPTAGAANRLRALLAQFKDGWDA
jgi:hypothetical protein